MSGEDRDQWCAALETGVNGGDLANTLPAGQGVDTTDVAGPLSRSIDADLQAYIAEECCKRLR
jgi:hypothetical protein